jgi:hypothetical protein
MKLSRAGIVTWLNCAALALLVGVLSACTEPRGPISVKSDDPTLKIPAIKEDVKSHDTKDVAQMVKDLNDDDPAVRFYSIEGLYRLSGDYFGYHYYDDEYARRPAIVRWNKWLSDRGGK